jgi:hypothetical protein
MPAGTFQPTAMVMIEEPAPVMESGLKLTVTPAGWLFAVKAMLELKPSATMVFIANVLLVPTVMYT